MEHDSMDETKNGADPANESPANENATAEAPRSLEERLAVAEAEAAELRDKALRALAEVENIRRRPPRVRPKYQSDMGCLPSRIEETPPGLQL